jgi:hypothetical protein
MEAGNGFTTKETRLAQPLGSVYAITVVPTDKPLATPVVEPTVATVVLLLVHVPPDVVFVKAAL